MNYRKVVELVSVSLITYSTISETKFVIFTYLYWFSGQRECSETKVFNSTGRAVKTFQIKQLSSHFLTLVELFVLNCI